MKDAIAINNRKAVEENPVIAVTILLAAALSVCSLVGWLLHWRILTSLGPHLATMKPNTALGVLFTAAAIWFSRSPALRRRDSLWAVLLTTFVIAVSAITISEYAFRLDFNIDEAFFRDSGAIGSSAPPGRPAPGTAVALLAVALAVLIIDRYPRISQALSLCTALVGLIGLIGYIYQLPTLFSAGRFTSLALNTVISLLGLCAGLLASRPDRGIARLLTASYARLQISVLLFGAIGLPILLGSFALWGERFGLYGSEFTLALFSVLLIVVMVALVWLTGTRHLALEQERAISQEALRDSEERFRTMADNIPNLAWMAHADGHIFWYNSRWYQYTGLPFESLEGWRWQAVHHPSFVDDVVSHWRQAIVSGESFEMEFPLRGHDGIFHWFLTRVSPVRNEEGKVIHWFGTNTNVDDRKRAEDALRRSEELARAVVEGTPEGVELLDETGQTLLINEQGRKFRELRRQPTARWVESWTERDFERAAGAFSAAVAGHSGSFATSLNLESPEPIWLDVQLTPLTQVEGESRRVLSVIRDVTTLRKSEERLHQTARLESLGVMAGGIAHDFNNLLTGILGNASLLEMSGTEEAAAIAREIVAASQRAADLTRQMLAYSGKGRFVLKRINLSNAVVEILELIKTTIDKKVQIVLDLDPDLPSIEADPGQMQQLIMNLIINGSDAIEGNVGKVSISTSVIDVDATFIAQTFRFDEPSLAVGSYVRLDVQDTGCGMSAETITRIFDPFFTTKFTGRGLGLAAVYGILRGHRGALRVYSHLGQGTTFKVFLPVAPGPVPLLIKDEELPTVLVAGHGAILLVDDESTIRHVGQLALQKKGYQVLLAENGREAVNCFTINRERIRMIILDLTMPVVGGEEALSLLRAIDPRIPILLSSGYNQIDLIRRFTTQKITGFLQKPYTTKQLYEAVADVLAAR